MNKIVQIGACLLFVLVGCKANHTGTYLISDAQMFINSELSTRDHNPQVSEKLKQVFKGKQLYLEFYSEYVVLNAPENEEKLILLKEDNNSEEIAIYKLEHNRGKEKVLLNLYKHMGDDKSKKFNLEIIVYNLIRSNGGELYNDKYGSIVCELKTQEPTNIQPSTPFMDYFNDLF